MAERSTPDCCKAVPGSNPGLAPTKMKVQAAIDEHPICRTSPKFVDEQSHGSKCTKKKLNPATGALSATGWCPFLLLVGALSCYRLVPFPATGWCPFPLLVGALSCYWLVPFPATGWRPAATTITMWWAITA
jgi:hypothetical protein